MEAYTHVIQLFFNMNGTKKTETIFCVNPDDLQEKLFHGKKRKYVYKYNVFRVEHIAGSLINNN